MTTLKDLARMLNLSESTISRALRDHPRISIETRRRVKELAERMDYVPNQLAVNLLRQRTNTIGVIVPRIGYHLYATAISGMEEEAGKEGFNIIIGQSAESFQRERSIIQEMMYARTAGFIASIASETADFEHFARVKRRGYPLVFFNRECAEIYTDRVVIDNVAAAREAVDYLIQTGCRRIAYIGGPAFVQISKKREQGYREALAAAGLPFRPQWVVHSEFNPASAREAAGQLLALPEPPDAVLAFSDQIAQNVLYIAKQRGVRIPEALSVIGFNNEPADALFDPALTSIEQPCFEMGRLAAELLIAQILKRYPFYRPRTRMLQARLILRNSTK
jgi:DNA-binding LacI/PurR family transcriptional regulator